MLKHIIGVALTATMLASCDSFSKKANDGFYGESFDTVNAVSASRLVGSSQSEVLVKGTVTSSCKTEGCWVKLDAGGGEEVFVSTEEKFFLPREGMSGKTVYVKGTAVTDTVAVEELRHLAADEGKTESEINAINAPKVEVSVVATGIKVL